MKLALESCRRKPLFAVDHAPWYGCAFEWLDVDWVPLTFSIRNYIERWYRTFKERTKRFYHNFGVREGKRQSRGSKGSPICSHSGTNRMRPHETLNVETPFSSSCRYQNNDG